MSTSRRSFIKASALAGGALGLGALPRIGRASVPLVGVPKASAPLKILILGGTGFTGPEQVEYATARGHSVTLINRNRTRPDFFKGRVEQLTGDLNGDMSALKGRKFDVVIDNPTTHPGWVRNVAQYMKGNTGHYVFISTISVYPDSSKAWADEDDKLSTMPDGVDPFTVPIAQARNYYGAMKTVSESEVQKNYPNAFTIIRPGLIVGKYDQTDRFTYWPYRIDKGGEVLAPGNGNDNVQFIDSRDLAEFTIRMAENRTLGIYNTTGPEKPLTMAEMLYGIKGVTTAGAQFTWVPAEFLTANRVNGWSQMPVWITPRANNAGFARRSIQRALEKGLTFRPLAVTAKDTLDWNKTRPAEELKRLADGQSSGLSAAREKEVLDLWKQKQASMEKP